MPPQISIYAITAILLGIIGSAGASSGKRGLCYVPNNKHPADNKIWIQPGSQLSWYYNYGSQPSAVFSKRPQSDFEFVPMMWGVSTNPEDTTFLRQVERLIDDRNVSVTHVLGFNEPNAPTSAGGSDISPRDAARAWVANFEPLASRGLKLGLPAMTGGPIGVLWLQQFLDNCSMILTDQHHSGGGGARRNCTWDFLPIHWYDNFDGLVQHIDERRAVWPHAKIWITEYAYAHRGHALTRAFFNKTLEYFDNNDYIARYTYYGAFRPGASQVGTYAALLNDQGGLNRMGKEYLNLNVNTPHVGSTDSSGNASDSGNDAVIEANGKSPRAILRRASLFAFAVASLVWVLL